MVSLTTPKTSEPPKPSSVKVLGRNTVRPTPPQQAVPIVDLVVDRVSVPARGRILTHLEARGEVDPSLTPSIALFTIAYSEAARQHLAPDDDYYVEDAVSFFAKARTLNSDVRCVVSFRTGQGGTPREGDFRNLGAFAARVGANWMTLAGQPVNRDWRTVEKLTSQIAALLEPMGVRLVPHLDMRSRTFIRDFDQALASLRASDRPLIFLTFAGWTDARLKAKMLAVRRAAQNGTWIGVLQCHSNDGPGAHRLFLLNWYGVAAVARLMYPRGGDRPSSLDQANRWLWADRHGVVHERHGADAPDHPSAAAWAHVRLTDDDSVADVEDLYALKWQHDCRCHIHAFDALRRAVAEGRGLKQILVEFDSFWACVPAALNWLAAGQVRLPLATTPASDQPRAA